MRLRDVVLVLSACMFPVGCGQSITGVQGWSGPETTVHVDRSGAEVTLRCPTGGWRVTIDRVTRTTDTATLYLTAHRPTNIVTQQITPVQVHWAAGAGASPTCVQAMIRIDEGRWLPAAESCR